MGDVIASDDAAGAQAHERDGAADQPIQQAELRVGAGSLIEEVGRLRSDVTPQGDRVCVHLHGVAKAVEQRHLRTWTEQLRAATHRHARVAAARPRGAGGRADA